jgi:hypothetical protein
MIGLATAIGTIGAVLVALGIVIAPAIWRRYKNRRLAEKKTYLTLCIIAKTIKDYRFYNPTQYIIEQGIVHFAYSLKELKIDVNVDLKAEIDNLMISMECLKKRNQEAVWKMLTPLKHLVSGFPQEKAHWDSLEAVIEEATRGLQFKKHVIGDNPKELSR